VPDSVAFDDAVALMADGRAALFLALAAALEPGLRVRETGADLVVDYLGRCSNLGRWE
jgi:hypothetical protein